MYLYVLMPPDEAHPASRPGETRRRLAAPRCDTQDHMGRGYIAVLDSTYYF